MTVITDAPEYIAGWVSGHFPYGHVFEQYHAIGLVSGRRLVAGCVFDQWNGETVNAHMVTDGRLNRAFLAEIHAFAYGTLGASEVICCCADDNLSAHKFLLNLGFQRSEERRPHFGGRQGIVFRQGRQVAERGLTLKS